MTETNEVPTAAAFLVMDESESRETGLEGMIGVVIPVANCAGIQHDWYRVVASLQNPPDNHFPLPPPIHGSKMLDQITWATDEHRFRCFATAVGIVNRYRLRVYRTAFYTASLRKMRAETRHAGAGDSRERGLHTLNLQRMASDSASQFLMIPLLDGLDIAIARPLAQSIQSAHAFRARGMPADRISIPYVDNYTEPVFADSRHSALIQIADCILYLLHVVDCRREGCRLSTFKARLCDVAETLDGPELVREQLLTMQYA